MSIQIEILNMDALNHQINALPQSSERVLQQTLGDAKDRIPGWVATEVAKHYGVSKSEVAGQQLGTMRIQGDSLRTLKFLYKGRMLTHTHFKMTPATPTGGTYTLKATIVKGQRSVLGKVKKLTKKQRKNIGKNFRRQGTQSSAHSPIMLMHTGSQREGGTDFIPFQRVSPNRKDVVARKAISLPQMITGERVAPGLLNTIDEKLSKRLQHYLRRLGR